MARRKDHTREELRELAIEAGTELVRNNGVGALTARNVAKAIGYTPGTLYNLFENIQGLVAAINARTLQGLAEDIEAQIQRCKTPESKLARICQLYIQLQDAEPKLCTLIFATPLENMTEDFGTAVHAVFDQVTEAIRPLSKNDTAARQDAKILWSTLHGICLLHQNGKLDVTEPDPPEQLVKRFLAQFLKR